jgi:hypothetical protein
MWTASEQTAEMPVEAQRRHMDVPLRDLIRTKCCVRCVAVLLAHTCTEYHNKY